MGIGLVKRLVLMQGLYMSAWDICNLKIRMMLRQSLCSCNGFVYALANFGKISLRLSYLVCNQTHRKLLYAYCQSLNLKYGCCHFVLILPYTCFTTYVLNIWSYQVRASAVFALGNLVDIGSPSLNGADDDSDDDEKVRAEINVVRSLLQISSDGSPLVRSEVAVGTWICLIHWTCTHLVMCQAYRFLLILWQ